MTAKLGSPRTPIPAQIDVAIIGGGVMGLCLAHHLAERSTLAIAVIERDYLASGASGRNGGGVRMQWSDADNVELMAESIRIYRHLAQELGINTWFRQGGYLFVARNSASEIALTRSIALQHRLGAPTRTLGPQEIKRLVPQISLEGIWMAAYNPDDGVVFPWALVWGYAKQAARRGVAIRTHTAVERITPCAGGYRLELASGEVVTAARVVNATGAWSPEINRPLGIDLPNRPHRHEILSSEPLKPFLDPLVVDLALGLYVSQSTRGELVTGITLPGTEKTSPEIDLGHSLTFLRHLSRGLVRLFPACAALKVLRQWSGPYDVSPDGDAIVGPSPGHPDFIQVCGFTGHGFMMAPAVGRILAAYLLRGETHPILQRWSPLRFQGEVRSRREDLIIG